jgi:hypothetical protein
MKIKMKTIEIHVKARKKKVVKRTKNKKATCIIGKAAFFATEIQLKTL